MRTMETQMWGRPGPELAGDFMALLARAGLETSARGQAREGSMPVEIQATTVFAFHFSGGVLVVGDRRATAGNFIVSDTVDKVIELDQTSVLAIAGVPATAFEMARVLQHSFEYYRRSQLQPLSLAAKVRALARLLRENMPMALQGVGIVSPLFAGVESTPEGGVPRIFYYDPLGANFQSADYVAAGSGSPTIRSVFGFETQFGRRKPSEMTLEEAVGFALRLLLTASQFDSATGGVDPEKSGFATIKVLTPTGIRTIEPAEQTAMFRKATA